MTWKLDPAVSTNVDPLPLSPCCSQLLVLIVETCLQLLNALPIGSSLGLESLNLSILFKDGLLIPDGVFICLNVPFCKGTLVDLALSFLLLSSLALFLLLLPLAGFNQLDHRLLQRHQLESNREPLMKSQTIVAHVQILLLDKPFFLGLQSLLVRQFRAGVAVIVNVIYVSRLIV